MKFLSTRGGGPVSLDEALRTGIASDGGLYLPEQLPNFALADFTAANTMSEVATILLRPFFVTSALEYDLEQIVAETFRFPIPTTPLPAAGQDVSLLELYHGPTAAFKDIGAGFLAACLARLEGKSIGAFE